MKFLKKASLFLVFICLFFYGFCGSSLVFAETNISSDAAELTALNNSDNSGDNNVKAKRNLLRVCNGIHNAVTTRKVIALTFDDGPHKKHTKEILDILKQYNIKATFFLLGSNVEEYPGIVKVIYADGHIIGNHTYYHYDATKLSNDMLEAELTKTGNLIFDKIKRVPALFRPPYGICSVKSAQLVKDLGFTIIMWNNTAKDYSASITPVKIANEIIRLAKPGAIITLHDGGGNRKNTVKALPMIIKALSRDGYEFLTIPELLGVNAYFLPLEDTVVTSPESNNIAPIIPSIPVLNIATLEIKGENRENDLEKSKQEL